MWKIDADSLGHPTRTAPADLLSGYNLCVNQGVITNRFGDEPLFPLTRLSLAEQT